MTYDDINAFHRDRIIKENRSVLNGTAFLEFGVFHGDSILMWYDLYYKNNLERRFIGFDSFQGIPEEAVDKNNLSGWSKGKLSTNGRINPILNKPDIYLVQGFFDESLVAETVQLLGGVQAGLVHIDCDTYSSTKIVWEWLLRYDVLAKEAVIVYDDWGGWLQAGCGEYEIGEAKAHVEIERTHNIKFIDLGKYVVDPLFYEVKVYKFGGRQ